MKDCDTCGNEIPDLATSCQFCGSEQHIENFPRSRERIRSINVETGLPSTAEALARLESDLARARYAGVRVVRVIHGWGSTGKGGALCEACRAFLLRQLAARSIKSVVPGDNYSRANAAARKLLSSWPQLKTTERSDTNNPGITLIEL